MKPSIHSQTFYALKSPEVRRQYQKLLKIFLDTIKFELDKNIEERPYRLFQHSISNKNGLKIKLFDSWNIKNSE